MNKNRGISPDGYRLNTSYNTNFSNTSNIRSREKLRSFRNSFDCSTDYSKLNNKPDLINLSNSIRNSDRKSYSIDTNNNSKIIKKIHNVK